ncbi:hypothetical protein GAYE_PCTG30G0699 [Galdieria yellowstonensis]|uniref:COG4 transport protein middle alpha-helical bundle domain-containing protein n=1 Tax=Galdieria yellowstonensis TaxID=3028027 RepID=A0AAV9I6G8_9RHOD|nr:hypothetical protein GAYE_PCTG30G0699 [Galdieria yellowstonensis]
MTCEDDVDKQLEKEISQVTAKITEMDQKIQSFTQQLVSKEERQKNVFDLLTTQVWDVVTETKELERAWESFQIQDICDKLNLFYIKSSRLEETHQLLERAIKRRKLLSQLKSCFSKGHLKEAVDCASELRKLGAENATPMEFLDKVLGEQSSTMESELQSLKNSLRQYIKDSSSKGYEALSKVYEHCIDLYRIGEEEEAFELYTTFILNVIEKEWSEALSRLQGHTLTHSSQYISLLTQLYETIASYADENEVGLTTQWSEQYYPKLLEKLMSRCNEYGTKIIDHYRRFRHLENVESTLTTTDTRQLDIIMDEIALVSQRTNAYFHFMENKLTAHQVHSKEYLSKVFRECLLQRKLDELISAYISMENYFMTESMKKAISLDQVPNDFSILVSTVVDDCFFVLQKSLKRAFAFENNDVLCAVINEANAVVNGQVLGFFKNRLGQILNVQKPESHASKTFDTTRQLVLLLNNLSTCEEYGERLIGWLDTWSRKRNSVMTVELEKVQSLVADLKDALKAFHTTWEETLQHLKGRITKRLARALEPLQQMSFVQQDVASGDWETDSDSFISHFAEEFESAVGYLEESLLDSNWDQLIRQIAIWCADQLESILWRKKFNAHGAFGLDNDVRGLTSFFNHKVKQGTVRDIFTRLFQITMLLNLESPTEIYDIWQGEERHIHWKLTAQEVRQVLSLRTEFSVETIKHLSL